MAHMLATDVLYTCDTLQEYQEIVDSLPNAPQIKNVRLNEQNLTILFDIDG